MTGNLCRTLGLAVAGTPASLGQRKDRLVEPRFLRRLEAQQWRESKKGSERKQRGESERRSSVLLAILR
jgi:hypothetical protein